MRVMFLVDANSFFCERFANEFASRGWDVDVVSYVHGRRERFHSNVRLHKIFRAPKGESLLEFFNRPLRIRQVKKLIREIKPDIVHAKNLWKWGVYGSKSGFSPLVIQVQGLHEITHNIRETRRLKKWEKSWNLRSEALKVSSVIIANVKQCKDMLLENYDIDENKILIMTLGLDINRFRRFSAGENMEHRKRMGIPVNAFVILSSRSILEIYNQEYILEAAERVLENEKNAFFVFMKGYAPVDGPYYTNIKNIAAEKGILDRLLFIDETVPYEDMPAMVNSADVSIMIPTTDTGPQSAFEAMACGVVPIVTDLPGNREFIEHGKNGFLVKPDDVDTMAELILKCARDRTMCESFAVENRRIVLERLDRKKYFDQLERLYLDLIKEHGKNS